MDKRFIIIAGLTLGGLAYLFSRQAQAGRLTAGIDAGIQAQSSIVDSITNGANTLMDSVKTGFINVPDAVNNSNVQAFMRVIRKGEGTSDEAGYLRLFGGGMVTSYADHPRQFIKRGTITSSAAGAYQFLSITWDEMAAKYKLPDFSPASQDIACVGLIKRRGALADVMAGNFDTAIAKCAKEWASLPGSPWGQPTISLNTAHQILAANGATEGVAA